MPKNDATKLSEESKPKRAFKGYAPPTSSTTYTPNQFFDVVLPHASRGCLRLVAYLIRKTLGWSDEQGNPQNPEAHVSYNELIERAGISRGAIKEAIQEALDKRFIQCLRFGQPHRPNEEGFSALYSLRWDEREEYVADPEEFQGFYAGNGNLTHIPNDFFDFTIPTEPLAVVQVIGVIIRNTIGWQSKYGMRRQQVELSFSDIMRRTRIGSRTTVSKALTVAIDGCHIRRVERGVFDRNAGIESKATVYAIRWADDNEDRAIRGTQPTLFELGEGNGSKSGPANRSKNWTGDPSVQKVDRSSTVQNMDREDSPKSGPANGSGSGPGTVQKVDSNEFKKRTDIKTTNINNTPKQQQTAEPEEGVVVGGAASLSLLIGKLMAEGIEPDTAARLVSEFSAERIERQLEWLSLRDVKSSRTGLLIRAIERDMPRPGVQTSERPAGWMFAAHFYAELAGNKGEPTAEPSAEEARLAKSLMARFPGREEQAIGRQFAKFVQRGEQGKKSPIRTLSLSLRLYGDEFFASVAADLERQAKELAARAKADHEKAFTATYQEFVRRLLDSHLEDPATAQAFEAHMEARFNKTKRLSEKVAEKLKERFSSDEGRAELLQDFLEGEKPGAIPTFWAWDATINKEPFSERSTEGIR